MKFSSNEGSGEPMRGSRGGGRVSGPLKNHKAIWFIGNTGPDPLENHKATIFLKLKENEQKNVVQTLTISDKTFWIRAWNLCKCLSLQVFAARLKKKRLAAYENSDQYLDRHVRVMP